MSFTTSSAARPTDALLIVYGQGKLDLANAELVEVTMEMSSGPEFLNRPYFLIKSEGDNNVINADKVKYSPTALPPGFELGVFETGVVETGLVEKGAVETGAGVVETGAGKGSLYIIKKSEPSRRGGDNGGEDLVADLSLINQSVDLAAGLGMALDLDEPGNKFFAIADKGNVHYDRGPRGDAMNLIAGVIGDMQVGLSRLAAGIFFTHGNGDYNTKGDNPYAQGKGEVEHTGVGALGRLNFSEESSEVRPYVEASVQAGRSDLTFRSTLTNTAYTSRHKSHAPYVGAHVGAGVVQKLDENSRLDLYGKFLYARQGSDDPMSKLDGRVGRVELDAIESRRLRLGGRYSWTAGVVNPYIGLAWEREFDGKTRVRESNTLFKSSEHKGNSGIIEFGLVMQPTSDQNLSLEVGVRGYVGKRRGVVGGAQLRYAF
jgi:hypothetical protein